MAVTIRDISKLAQVSTTTVSKVLNGDYRKVSTKTRDRILQVSRELNYRPNMLARGLVRQQSHLIGLLMPDLSNPYYTEMSRGIIDSAFTSGYNIIISNTDELHLREESYIKMMAEYNVGGIILVGGPQNVDANLELLNHYQIPFVCVENYRENLEYCVYVDNFMGSYRIVEYFLDHGHHNIAYISGLGSLQDNSDGRLLGYQAALRDHGIEVNPYLVESGTYDIETGFQKTVQLLSRGIEFTAISCGNDLIALGAFQAIMAQGLRVPDDISLIGFDDVYLSALMDPPLTTMKQPGYEIGVCSLHMMTNRIEGRAMKPEEKVRCFEPRLIERNSVSHLVSR